MNVFQGFYPAEGFQRVSIIETRNVEQTEHTTFKNLQGQPTANRLETITVELADGHVIHSEAWKSFDKQEVFIRLLSWYSEKTRSLATPPSTGRSRQGLDEWRKKHFFLD